MTLAHDKHLLGHSDADVLLHAVTDALLGAVGLGDIGEYFPNTDPHNRGRDSSEMLLHAASAVRAAGWQIINLDCVVEAQRPKISEHKMAIRQRIAELLALSPDEIGLKGKTGEEVGIVGREEAIVAHCVALVGRL